LDEKVAPTNKQIAMGKQLWRLNPKFVNKLTKYGYVYAYEKPKGLTISDAPTGTRPQSDYRRLTTMRIVKRAIDTFRAKADPFIGNAFGAAVKAAAETAIREGLTKMSKDGYLRRYDLNMYQTAAQSAIGDMTAELQLVPAFELRRIYLKVSLSAQ
jgi:hypothetical protein